MPKKSSFQGLIPTVENIPLLLITLFIGIVIGALYGWRSGYTDGEVAGHLPSKSFLKAFGALRGTNDVKGRDLLIDLQAINAANVFVHGHSYSPLYYMMHSKADEGLLHVEAYWELNYSLPSVWKNGIHPPLFDEGSPEDKCMKALKAKRPNEYQRILKQHQEMRGKNSDKADS